MSHNDELFTRKIGGGRRTYYLDVKRDSNGDKYIAISESTRRDDGQRMRNRVMVWREDFKEFFDCLRDMEAFLADDIRRVDEQNAARRRVRDDPHAHKRSTAGAS